MKPSNDIRALALIGARFRREELRLELAEVEATIKALQATPSKAASKVKPKKRRKYSEKLKAAVIADAKTGTTADVARKHGLSYNTVFNWTR
jgi:hypothetical protein